MDILYFVDTILFWGFVYVIVFMGCDTPQIIFGGFGLFLIYWILRFIFKQEGTTKMIWLYVFNLVITIFLLFYFITGVSVQKQIRMMMNSAARKYPTLDPYVRSC